MTGTYSAPRPFGRLSNISIKTRCVVDWSTKLRIGPGRRAGRTGNCHRLRWKGIVVTFGCLESLELLWQFPASDLP